MGLALKGIEGIQNFFQVQIRKLFSIWLAVSLVLQPSLVWSDDDDRDSEQSAEVFYQEMSQRLRRMNHLVEFAQQVLKQKARAIELPKEVDLTGDDWQKFLPEHADRPKGPVATASLSEEIQDRLRWREIEKLVDQGIEMPATPELGRVEPTRIGDVLAFRVIPKDCDIVYLFINSESRDATFESLSKSEFYKGWIQKMHRDLDQFVQSLEHNPDVSPDLFAEQFLERVNEFHRKHDLFSEWLQNEEEKRQKLFETRLRKYIARQHREAGISRRDGVDGRHVVVVWKEKHALKTEIFAKPERFTREWWSDGWATTYTKPTAAQVNAGVIAGLTQIPVGLIPPTLVYLFNGTSQFYWQMAALNYMFGTTIGIYGTTYSNWVNAGKKTGFRYNLSHAMKASSISLAFSAALALWVPEIYTGGESYQFLSLTTLSIVGYLLSSAVFNNFLKSNVRLLPRVREKARANTYEYEMQLPLLGKKISLSRKNVEYQIFTETPLNLVKNLDLIKFDLPGGGLPFMNLSRITLATLAVLSGPSVSWYASTRYPKAAQEMGLYRDPSQYGEGYFEFSKNWFSEVLGKLAQGAAQGLRLLQPHVLVAEIEKQRMRREDDRVVREIADKAEAARLESIPAKVHLFRQPCFNL